MQCDISKKFCSFEIMDSVLVMKINNIEADVLSFPILVKILHKVHTEVCYLGKYKLLDVVKSQFGIQA